ncbi:MAG: hypothetical protein DIU54_011680 [Acidobacteriota bacterium]|jgi:hypothetical protein|nr:MAG: hypothetical protein DIU54_14585 [Acidobacteriota bacterium]
MSDAGEGLIDAESRIQERMEELERERSERSAGVLTDPEARRAVESLKLARKEFERQLSLTTHELRRRQLTEALAEVDRKLEEAMAKL